MRARAGRATWCTDTPHVSADSCSARTADRYAPPMDIRHTAPVRGLVALVVLAVLVALVALPVLAADPSPSSSHAPSGSSASAGPSAEPSGEPESSDGPKPPKAQNREKGPKTPEIDVRVTGTVRSTTDDKGRAHYTVSAGGRTYELAAGPPWFWGDDHPLKPFVGKAVTIAGGQHEGSDEIEVATVNGTAIGAPGRPPWAGGWKVVGERHPGWSKEKQERWQAKAAARDGCFPPGHCKDKTKAEPSATDDPGE